MRESIRLKIQAKGPICKSRSKKIESLGLFLDDDDDDKEEDTSSSSSSSWLSSSNGDYMSSISSPSYCSCSCSDDQIFINFLKFSLDDWLVSLLISSSTDLLSSPRFSKTTVFFDGSSLNPLEDAAFVLQLISSSYQQQIFHDNGLSSSSEEEISAWLMKSVKDEDDEWDGFLGSLIDLDGENSELISNEPPNIEFFNINLPIDFPSPSCYKNNWSSSNSTDKFAAVAEEESGQEYEELTDFGSGDDGDSDGEPLFWPCDTKFDWGSEFSWDFLIMSPRKNTRKPGNLHERIKLALCRGK